MEGNFRKCYPNDMMNILKMKNPIIQIKQKKKVKRHKQEFLQRWSTLPYKYRKVA